MPTPKPAPQQDGSTRYRVRFRDVAGRSCSRTFIYQEDAEQFCVDIETGGVALAMKLLDVREAEALGEDPAADSTPRLDKVADDFFEWKAHYVRGERTVPEYRKAYAIGIKPYLGSRRVGSITHEDVARWVEMMATGKISKRSSAKDPGEPKRLSPKTIQGRHSLLHAIMDYAARPPRSYIPANPCKGPTDLPDRLTPTPKGLMPAQWHELHDNLINDDETDAADLAAFLVGSGWRYGEAVALPVSAVEDYGADKPMWVSMGQVMRRQSDGTYRIVTAEGKAQRSMRRIQLDPQTAAIVRRRAKGKRHAELVFTHHGDPWQHHLFRVRFTRAAKAAGLDGATIHWLRHTHVAWLAMSGAPLPELQRRIGHASITTTIGVYGSIIGDVGTDTLTAFTALRDSATRPPIHLESAPADQERHIGSPS